MFYFGCVCLLLSTWVMVFPRHISVFVVGRTFSGFGAGKPNRNFLFSTKTKTLKTSNGNSMYIANTNPNTHSDIGRHLGISISFSHLLGPTNMDAKGFNSVLWPPCNRFLNPVSLQISVHQFSCYIAFEINNFGI